MLKDMKLIFENQNLFLLLDENYNIVYKFNTINEAAKFINRNHANICVACKDIHKTCKGLHWQYVE